MRSIFLKEINSFFSSIVGYVSIGVFLVASGLFLWVLEDSSILSYGTASMDQFFNLAPWLLLLLIPAVTMRSFADEYRGGTIEWLATKPITHLDIILGKYFASLVLIIFALIPTFIYVYSIQALAVPRTEIDMGAIAGSYIGLFFLAAGFAAVGIFCSSLTANQVVGFLMALFACYILYSGFQGLSKVIADENGYGYFLSMGGMQFHYNSISRGIIDSRDVIYFLSIIILFIACTRYSLSRRNGWV